YILREDTEISRAHCRRRSARWSGLRARPGYLYSNAGYTLLALVVEKASGLSFRAYLASRILRLPGGRGAGGFWDGEPAVAAPGPSAASATARPATRGVSAGRTGPWRATAASP
ncbi:serine hydrolase, partial [Streptosporangium vulgare]|uniref:serine hydrolase n=1 Tax=Streptosporangium vulgare TaxID=46190 RepID=UPI0031D4B2F6